MRLRRSVGLVLSIAVAMVGAPDALADATPTPTPLSYRAAMDQYRMTMTTRDQIRKEINFTFLTAVMTANNVAKSAMRMAKSAEAKSNILSQQKNGIALATAARDAAILAMGPPPIEPIDPNKKVRGLKARNSDATKISKPSKVSPTPTP